MRVLVPDAPPLVRAGVRTAVDAVPELSYDKGDSPDVVVAVDPAAARRYPDARVLLLAKEARQAIDVTAAGCVGGCVTYDVELADIVEAICAVGRGEAFYSAPVADALVAALTEPPDAAAEAFPALTGRERDVLERLATGASNWDIAQALGLSTKTVRNHLSRIYVKLGVLDRAQAVLRARDAGLG